MTLLLNPAGVGVAPAVPSIPPFQGVSIMPPSSQTSRFAASSSADECGDPQCVFRIPTFPHYAADRDPGSWWTAGPPNSLPHWWQVDLGSIRHFYQYEITPARGNEAPRSWTLRISGSGTPNTIVDTRSAQSFGNGQKRTYVIPNGPIQARYVRLHVTSSSSSGGWITLNEFDLLQ